MHFAVLGPGAVGGFLAAILWRAGHQVTCVGRPTSVERIRRNGIVLKSASLGDVHARPNAEAELTRPAAAVFVTVKCPMLRDATSRVAASAAETAIVLPLLNGVEHMGTLRARFGDRVVPATIGQVEVFRSDATTVVHASAASAIEAAPAGSVTAADLQRLNEILAPLGAPIVVMPDEPTAIWSKLSRLAPLAAVTAASGLDLGACQADSVWASRLDAGVREAVGVANAEGYDVEPAAVLDRIRRLPRNLRTSLQRDVDAGRMTEADCIVGAVVRRGRQHGIACPTLHQLQELIADRVARVGAPA